MDGGFPPPPLALVTFQRHDTFISISTHRPAYASLTAMSIPIEETSREISKSRARMISLRATREKLPSIGDSTKVLPVVLLVDDDTRANALRLRNDARPSTIWK